MQKKIFFNDKTLPLPPKKEIESLKIQICILRLNDKTYFLLALQEEASNPPAFLTDQRNSKVYVL